MDIDELLAEDTVHPQFEQGQGWLAGMDRESDSWLDQVLLCRGDETETALSGGFSAPWEPDRAPPPGS